MRANAVILIIICLLFLTGTVAAIIPDVVTITSDKSFVIAGSNEQSTIKVTITNSTLGVPIQGAAVSFLVDPFYGTISPASGITNPSGSVSSIFKVGNKSGIPNILINVSYLNESQAFTLAQRIDHNKAFYVSFSHPLEGEVNTTVPLNISFTDFFGNPIDRLINSNQTHAINLHIYGPPPDDCNFVGYGHDIIGQPLDQDGKVSLQVKLTTGAGPNSITMDQFDLIPPPSQRIITAISSDVSSMQFSINPTSPPGVPADGTSKFSIIYTLYDRFRNPASQKELLVNTSLGESTKFKTDNLGRIAITYGPRIDPGVITIDATAVANPLVNSSDQVEFISTAATTIVLTANPEIMVSRDKNALATSLIIAKITNIMGGTSPNETVRFSLGTEQYPGGPYNVTNKSSFSPTSLNTTINAITDANGNAMVNFYPGGFNPNPMAVNYSSTATGQVVITAKWTNVSGTTVSKDITVKWKNYPYLSAKTSVNPNRIDINDTVDVTIHLDADGWAIQPKPIDVVLVIDKSGSMALGGRMTSAKNAATSFVNSPNITEGIDRIGIVSYSYENTVTRDADLGASFSTVKSKINAINPDGGTAMREGFKQSIGHMITSGRPTAVRAVILMTDGNWNNGGSPLAVGKGFDMTTWVRDNRDTDIGSSSRYYGFSSLRNDFEDEDYRWYSDMGVNGGTISGPRNNVQVIKDPVGIDESSGTILNSQSYSTKNNVSYSDNGQFTWQNMSIYAKDNNIRLYTLSFASTIPTSERDALITLANSTGGFYRHAPDQAALEKVYADIAGELKDTAGVDTTMVTDFSKVNVTGVDVNGSEVFDYVYHPTASTKITWQDGISNVTDQSADWAADNKLNFTIGTMKVGQTWEATFRLKVKKSGSVDVFGLNSALLFNNSGSLETLNLPRTFLTVNPNLTAGLESEQINVVGSCLVLDQNKAILPINWWTTYTGGPNVIFEEVNYIDDTGAHVTFYRGNYPVNTSTFTQRNTIFDMKTVPQNRYYTIEVRTFTPNVQDSKQVCGGAIYNSTGRTYIKLN